MFELARRPLRLPHVELRGGSIEEHGVAGRCVEGRRTAVNAIVFREIPGLVALGPDPADPTAGPVHAALTEGAPRLVFLAGLPSPGEWRVVRTLWISQPSYDGPVLVRGGRLDARGVLGFGEKPPFRESLRLPAGGWPGTAVGPREGGLARRAGWRVTAVPTLIREPGCYAFQVDGFGFSYLLPFGVQSR